ncbi:hypothetical protein D3C78_1733560 [compost metagenome]
MAALFQFILNIFVYFANFAIAKLGARYGIRLALVAFWLAAVAVLTASINGILSGLVTTVHPIVQTALGLLPASTGACIAALAACRAACWLYVSGVYVASVKARV